MKLKLLLLFSLFFCAASAQDSLLTKRYKDLKNPLALQYSPAVKDFVKHWSGPGKKDMEGALSRSQYYFPLMDTLLNKEGLPNQLKFLAMATSDLRFDYFDSLDGARGLWHFNYAQAKLFDLKITSYEDARLDPTLSSQAFVRAIKEYHNIYKDWELAVAAFISSAPKVNKAIRYHHDTVSYWVIRKDLDTLASQIISRMLAAEILYKNQVAYKMQLKNWQVPKVAATIYVYDWCSLDQVAVKGGVGIETLTFLNPIYKRHIIPDKLDSFALHVPAKLKDSADWIRGLRYVPYDAYYFEKKTLPDSVDEIRIDTLKHVVKTGETIESIATTYLVSSDELMEWNGLEEDELLVGETLIIYHEVKVDVPKPIVKPKPTPAGTYRIHTVRSGDTLSGIAAKYRCSVSDIKRWNNLHSNMIRIGQKLKIYR